MYLNSARADLQNKKALFDRDIYIAEKILVHRSAHARYKELIENEIHFVTPERHALKAHRGTVQSVRWFMTNGVSELASGYNSTFG